MLEPGLAEHVNKESSELHIVQAPLLHVGGD
jgi:hypothetical protein